MVNLTVSAAGKPPSLAQELPFTAEIAGADATVADVKALVASKFPKFHTTRQKICLKGDNKMLSDETKLKDLGILEVGELSLKDLGPQISWRTVFLVEYAGPLLIHPFIFHFPKIVYGVPVQHSSLQKYVYTFILLHFLKRELETLFVHRFSHATMPAKNIFKNSVHYHLFSGLVLAYDIYRPRFSVPYVRGTIRDEPRFLWICTAIWLFAEISNLSTHLTLRALRPPGTRKRAIPNGYGFSLISCPNYFFESMAWFTICCMTNSVAAWTFLVISVGQMGIWALKKHKNYKKEFGKQYPKGRKALIPFVL